MFDPFCPGLKSLAFFLIVPRSSSSNNHRSADLPKQYMKTRRNGLLDVQVRQNTFFRPLRLQYLDPSQTSHETYQFLVDMFVEHPKQHIFVEHLLHKKGAPPKRKWPTPQAIDDHACHFRCGRIRPTRQSKLINRFECANLYSLSQWLNFKLFGITYLVGKIKFKLFFSDSTG